MKMISAVIVDDESLARERIRTLLEGEADFEVVAECEDGRQAIEAIERLAPDLLFLDVQMPEIDGFDVLLSVDRGKLPAVIFVTAYDQYAVRAFEVHALDYLLKPFDSERFSEALNRARQQVAGHKPGDLQKEISGLLDDLKATRRASSRILIRSGGRIHFLTSDEIDWVEAAGNYVHIHRGSQSFLLRETMKEMEKRLAPEAFVRIHRSTIVNIERIKEMQPAFNGEYVVFLKNGTELKLSRNYRASVEERIGKLL